MQACILFTASPSSESTVKNIRQLCREFGLEPGKTLSDGTSSCLAQEAHSTARIEFSALRVAAASYQIDVNEIQPDARIKKLLIADMDATIIRGESLDELAALAGIGSQISAITARAMAGELDFEQALAARLALLKGQPASLLDAVVKGVKITPGAHCLVATMRAHGAECYLVSGGFTFLTSVIAQQLGFTGHHANQLGLTGSQLSGTALPPILGKQAKRDFLHHYCGQMNIPLSQSLCVGDGANDMMMLQEAGLGVAFEGKPALRAAIDTQISYSDLTALLYLQGYDARDFAA